MSPTDKCLSRYVFLFAHGAGADKDSEWMVNMDRLLSEKKLKVVRFNFPYMIKRAEDGKRRPPDRQPKLIQAFKEQIEKLPGNSKLIIGGKSMGGRMASILAATEKLERDISGVICLGFPFHPPKKPEKFRGEHLQDIKTKTLILQGERDTFGNQQEVTEFDFSDNVSVQFLTDGDHGFKPRVKSGLTLQDNLQSTADKIIAFINSL